MSILRSLKWTLQLIYLNILLGRLNKLHCYMLHCHQSQGLSHTYLNAVDRKYHQTYREAQKLHKKTATIREYLLKNRSNQQ